MYSDVSATSEKMEDVTNGVILIKCEFWVGKTDCSVDAGITRGVLKGEIPRLLFIIELKLKALTLVGICIVKKVHTVWNPHNEIRGANHLLNMEPS